MDLAEFVAQSLTQVAEGVARSSRTVREAGGFVNPSMSGFISPGSYIGITESGHHVSLVEFDVAITVSKGKGTNAEAKLEVASFLGLKAGGRSGEDIQSTSRVKFAVPIALPVDTVTRQKFEEKQAQDKAKVDADAAAYRKSRRM